MAVGRIERAALIYIQLLTYYIQLLTYYIQLLTYYIQLLTYYHLSDIGAWLQ